MTNIGITTFGGDGGKSGISQYIINLISQFSTIATHSTFDTLVYEDERDIFIPNESKIHASTFDARLKNPIVNIAWHQFALRKWCKSKRYDVLFLPAANRRLPFCSPCPTVGTVHDFSSLHVKGKYDAGREFYIRKILPTLIRRLTTVITISECSKRDIIEYAQVPPEQIHVIPLAADTTFFYPREKQVSQNIIQSKYGIEGPFIVYISRIEHPGKNHARLIEAFSTFKARSGAPHKLVLAGSDWNRAEEVHKAAERSSYREDVHFTGFFPGQDLADLYCASEFLVFPSLFEGFGLPVLEAMSCGTPVACSDISSLPEVAGGAAMLFNPYDVDSMAEVIESLAGSDEKRKELASRSLARSKEFSWVKTAEKTLEVIHSTAKQGRK